MGNSYEDELGFVKEADDDLFPSFLFNPLFNDFNDNYYKNSFANDELITMVKRLRRRYSNFFDWVDAMEIYNEYMDIILDKYGSMRVVQNALKNGTMEDPIPSKPKLKNTKRNRQFMRSGIAPSRQVGVEPLSDDELIVIARQSIPDAMGENILEENSRKDLPKKLRKRLHAMSDNMAGQNRKRNLYRSVVNNHGTDFIVEYLNQTKRGIYDHSGHATNDENMSLMDIVREQERIDETRPEFLDNEFGNETSIVNGRLVRRKDYERMEIYKELYSAGIDVIGNFGKSMDKRAVKMVRSYIGDTEPSSKKELKKLKKRMKKDQERIERRRDSNALLEQTLLGNKFSFNENEDSLTFRLKDIYRD